MTDFEPGQRDEVCVSVRVSGRLRTRQYPRRGSAARGELLGRRSGQGPQRHAGILSDVCVKPRSRLGAQIRVTTRGPNQRLARRAGSAHAQRSCGQTFAHLSKSDLNICHRDADIDQDAAILAGVGEGGHRRRYAVERGTRWLGPVIVLMITRSLCGRAPHWAICQTNRWSRSMRRNYVRLARFVQISIPKSWMRNRPGAWQWLPISRREHGGRRKPIHTASGWDDSHDQ